MSDSIYRYWRHHENRHFTGKNHPRDPKGQWTEKGAGGTKGGQPLDLPPPAKTTTADLRLEAKTKLPGKKLNNPGTAPYTRLSDRDREVVLDYAWSASNFERMNSALRRDPDREVDPDTARGIRELTEVLNKHKLDQPVRVYRGTGRADGSKWAQSVRHSNDGRVVDHGFTSTSTDEEVARMMADPMDEGDGAMFVIDLPAGTKAISIGDQFDDVGGFNQEEVLLQRGSRFDLVDQYMRDGMVYRHLVLKEQP